MFGLARWERLMLGNVNLLCSVLMLVLKLARNIQFLEYLSWVLRKLLPMCGMATYISVLVPMGDVISNNTYFLLNLIFFQKPIQNSILGSHYHLPCWYVRWNLFYSHSKTRHGLTGQNSNLGTHQKNEWWIQGIV